MFSTLKICKILPDCHKITNPLGLHSSSMSSLVISSNFLLDSGTRVGPQPYTSPGFYSIVCENNTISLAI